MQAIFSLCRSLNFNEKANREKVCAIPLSELDSLPDINAQRMEVVPELGLPELQMPAR